MAKEAPAIPADKLELYEKLVATNPNVKRKGATVPYTSLNGHMFSYLSKTGTLALRLPTEAREAFLKKYKEVYTGTAYFSPATVAERYAIPVSDRSSSPNGRRLRLFRDQE
jgi:hypothetical protein